MGAGVEMGFGCVEGVWDRCQVEEAGEEEATGAGADDGDFRVDGGGGCSAYGGLGAGDQ